MVLETKYPTITIITTTYTQERYNDLMSLLESIRTQTSGNIDALIVVERSEELAEKIISYVKENNLDNFHVLFNSGEWGLSASRNLAIGQAAGDIVAFIDDDAVLLPDWAVATASAYAEDNDIIGLTGPIIPLWENKAMDWFPREFYWIFSCTYWDWTEKREVRNGYGTNISFRREAFAAGGLFKTDLGAKGGGKSGKHELGGEETEFSVRVINKTGKKIVYAPDAAVKHRVYQYRFNTGFITKRAYWEGRTKASLSKLSKNGPQSRVELSTEYDLLRRIAKLVPRIIKRFFSKPAVAVRQSWITGIILLCVAAGYVAILLFERK